MPKTKGEPKMPAFTRNLSSSDVPRPGASYPLSRRILIVDGQQLFAQGLQLLLDRLPDIEVVGWGRDGREAVNLARQLAPDVVVMDVSMPNLNGIEATRRITHHVAGVRVLCLTTCSDSHCVTAALAAGAAGYLLKSCAFEELERALEAVLGHQTYLSPAVANSVVEAMKNPRATTRATVVSRLSDRECEVLQLLAEGHSTRAIAEDLHLSPKTIYSHRHRIMAKVGVRSLAALVKLAVKEGLTAADP